MCNLVPLGAGDEYSHGLKWASNRRLCQLAWLALHLGHPTIHILELPHLKLFYFLGVGCDQQCFFIPHNTFCSNVLFGGLSHIRSADSQTSIKMLWQNTDM